LSLNSPQIWPQVQTRPTAAQGDAKTAAQEPVPQQAAQAAAGGEVSLPSALEVVDGGAEADKRSGGTSGISSGMRLENVS
jgi:hypothetical protein